MYKIITSVSSEPVSLAEAILHLRVTESIEGSLIASLIKAAREYCENITGRALALQEVELMLKDFPPGDCIELPLPPLQSVESIKYKNFEGIETELDPADYIVDTDSTIGKVCLSYGKSWPAFNPYPLHPVRISFTAGYLEAPTPLKQAILLLVGHWYENREAAGAVSKEIEFSVTSLISQYRVRWF